jgi:hypothetical protein
LPVSYVSEHSVLPLVLAEGGFHTNREIFVAEVEILGASQLPEMVGISAGADEGDTSQVGWNRFIHFPTTFPLMEGMGD